MRVPGSGPVAAAVVTLATLVLAYGFAPGVDRAVGEQDRLLFRNFHEVQALGRVLYRWSKGGNRGESRASVIVVPQVGYGTGGRLEIQVRTPEDIPAVPLTIAAGGRTLAVANVRGRTTISVAVPRAARGGGDARIALLSPAWTTAKDPRPRGVAVERVGWRPGRWTFPPARQLWMLPLIAAALALLAARLRATTPAGRIVPAVLGGLIALGAAWRPLEVAPFSHRLLAGAVLAHVGLTLWAALVRAPGRRWWELPPEVDSPALLVAMGIGYWMVVAAHAALCAEARTLCPGPVAAAAVLCVPAGLVVAAALPSRRRLPAALFVIAAGAVVQGTASGVLAFRRSAVDFGTLWIAAHDWSIGGSLYKPDEVAANHFGAVFKVPPFYGMVLLPYTRTDVRSALTLHREIDVALYLGCAAVLFRRLRPRLGTGVALAAAATVFGLMQPAFDSIAYGQVDVVLLALLTATFLAWRAGHPALVGVLVAGAALLKLYPLLLVLFFAARREWRALLWTGAWLLALDAVAVAVMGWREHVVYLSEVLPRIGGGTGWVENQTLNGFLCRLLMAAHRPEPVHDRVVDLLTWAGFVVVAGVSAVAAARRVAADSGAAVLHFAAFLVAMVLAVPAAWIHYETVTIFAFLALAWSAAGRPLSAALAAAAALAFALVAYGNQWTFYDGSPLPGLTALGLSREFYGLLVLWIVVLVAARRLASHASPGTGTWPPETVAVSRRTRKVAPDTAQSL